MCSVSSGSSISAAGTRTTSIGGTSAPSIGGTYLGGPMPGSAYTSGNTTLLGASIGTQTGGAVTKPVVGGGGTGGGGRPVAKY